VTHEAAHVLPNERVQLQSTQQLRLHADHERLAEEHAPERVQQVRVGVHELPGLRQMCIGTRVNNPTPTTNVSGEMLDADSDADGQRTGEQVAQSHARRNFFRQEMNETERGSAIQTDTASAASRE
jgi:hypothetical protein